MLTVSLGKTNSLCYHRAFHPTIPTAKLRPPQPIPATKMIPMITPMLSMLHIYDYARGYMPTTLPIHITVHNS